jgi:hypothetical protein
LVDSVLNEKEERKKGDKKVGGGPADREKEKIREKLVASFRKFQNVIKACTLKGLILRMVDKMESSKAGGKRYFYRPISAIKGKHKLK